MSTKAAAKLIIKFQNVSIRYLGLEPPRLSVQTFNI
jgi:hypothetical protein